MDTNEAFSLAQKNNTLQEVKYIRLAIHLGWTDIELECDGAMVVAALACPDEDCSEIGKVIVDCKDYIFIIFSLFLL